MDVHDTHDTDNAMPMVITQVKMIIPHPFDLPRYGTAYNKRGMDAEMLSAVAAVCQDEPLQATPDGKAAGR
jgi:hypothetical protein